VDRVSIRDLRNKGGEVVDRVVRGERVTITRSGKPVAELRPLQADALPGSVLLERWHRLPRFDPARLRRDIDASLDPNL
jgi:prevent-host-death family protein